MKRIALLFCVVGLAAAPVVNAQSREGSWETELGVIFQNSSDADFEGGTQADFDSDVSWLFGISYHYTDQLQFGGTLSFGQTDYDADIAADVNGDEQPDGFVSVSGDLDFMTLMGNATYNFLPGQFSPFVTGGIGWSWVDTNIATEPPQTGCWWDPWYGQICGTWQNTRSTEEFMYGLGAGVRWDVNDAWSLRFGYDKRWIDANGSPDLDQIKLGVTMMY